MSDTHHEQTIQYIVRFWDCGEPLSDKYNKSTTDLDVARKEKERYMAIDPEYTAVIYKITTEVIE